MATINKRMKTFSYPNGNDTISYEIFDDNGRKCIAKDWYANSTAKFSAGEYVIKDGICYMFETTHAANTLWSSSEVVVTNLGAELYDVKTALAAMQGGLTENIKQALLNCFQNVAWIDDDGQDYYDALEDALYANTLDSISAVYTQSGTVYDSASLNDLKSDLVVTAYYRDSSTSTITNYTLSGTLTAGTSTITVSYGGKTTTFTVTVTAEPTLQSISAVYTQSGTVYDNASLDDLKSDLVVTAHYTDSSTSTITNYTLSGTLSAGTSTITVSYGGKSTTFTVTVTATPALDSISAVYGDTNPVYNTDSIDDLKADLTVKAIYTGGAEETITNYSLSGTLSGGNQTITVTYSGKTTTFNVKVYEFGFVKGIVSGQTDSKACLKTNTTRICAAANVGVIPMNYEGGTASPYYGLPLRSDCGRIYVSSELSSYRKAYIILAYDASKNDYVQVASTGWMTDQNSWISPDYRNKNYLAVINVSGATGSEDMSNVDTTGWSAYFGPHQE